MKGIAEGQDTRGEQRLLKDLAFIKRKLRYPISKRTMPAFFVLAGIIYFLSRAVLGIFVIQKVHFFLALAIGAITIMAVASAFYGYVQTLRFKVISTPFTQSENIRLVHDFLRSQQLLIYELAEAPEVCQIASRPLGSAKEDRREIMVFIADDNRILINSHFTGQKYGVSSPSKNYKMMARELNSWLLANYKNEIMTMQNSH